MDCTDNHILLASAPLELLVLQLEGFGSSGGNSGPDGRPSSALGKTSLVAVRELSLFNVGRPVQDVALVSAAAADMAQKALRGADAHEGLRGPFSPALCIITPAPIFMLCCV